MLSTEDAATALRLWKARDRQREEVQDASKLSVHRRRVGSRESSIQRAIALVRRVSGLGLSEAALAKTLAEIGSLNLSRHTDEIVDALMSTPKLRVVDLPDVCLICGALVRDYSGFRSSLGKRMAKDLAAAMEAEHAWDGVPGSPIATVREAGPLLGADKDGEGDDSDSDIDLDAMLGGGAASRSKASSKGDTASVPAGRFGVLFAMLLEMFDHGVFVSWSSLEKILGAVIGSTTAVSTAVGPSEEDDTMDAESWRDDPRDVELCGSLGPRRPEYWPPAGRDGFIRPPLEALAERPTKEASKMALVLAPLVLPAFESVLPSLAGFLPRMLASSSAEVRAAWPRIPPSLPSAKVYSAIMGPIDRLYDAAQFRVQSLRRKFLRERLRSRALEQEHGTLTAKQSQRFREKRQASLEAEEVVSRLGVAVGREGLPAYPPDPVKEEVAPSAVRLLVSLAEQTSLNPGAPFDSEEEKELYRGWTSLRLLFNEAFLSDPRKESIEEMERAISSRAEKGRIRAENAALAASSGSEQFQPAEERAAASRSGLSASVEMLERLGLLSGAAAPKTRGAASGPALAAQAPVMAPTPAEADKDDDLGDDDEGELRRAVSALEHVADEDEEDDDEVSKESVRKSRREMVDAMLLSLLSEVRTSSDADAWALRFLQSGLHTKQGKARLAQATIVAAQTSGVPLTFVLRAVARVNDATAPHDNNDDTLLRKASPPLIQPVLDLLMSEYSYLVRRRSNSRQRDKAANIRLVCELVKFGLLPPAMFCKRWVEVSVDKSAVGRFGDQAVAECSSP
jgi:hypothetical protein